MELKAAILCSLLVSCSSGASLFSEDTALNERDQLNLEGEALKSIASKVNFYLYTKEHNYDYKLKMGDLVLLKNSTFNTSRPTKIAIHGYEHNYKYESCQLIKNAYLTSTQDVNVICVNWGKLCMGPPLGVYLEAVYHVPKVGKLLGEFIDFLVKNGSADVSSFHLIGHSLGAHVAAFAANTVTSGNISRISGLDPALPVYGSLPINKRLDPTDAEMVDVIHTSGGVYGFYKPLGTMDFYPNGGKPIQPGCGFDYDISCSHASVVRYYASSVFNSFEAKSCSAFVDVKKAKCDGPVGYMGDPANSSYSGVYYLKTSGTYPYALNVGGL